MMSLADTILLSAVVSQSVRHEQLIMMSPVVKKRRVDWPIRTESTESVTDMAKMTEEVKVITLLKGHIKIQRSPHTLRP